MPVVYKNCCICIGLRKGSLIIGYVNLAILLCLATASIYDITTGTGPKRHSLIKPQRISWTSVVPSYVMLVSIIISFVFTILLLIGVHGNKRSLVNTYVIFNSVFLVVYLVGFVTQLGNGGITMVVNDLFVVCVTLYYIMITRSYYNMLEEEANPDTECESSRYITNT